MVDPAGMWPGEGTAPVGCVPASDGHVPATVLLSLSAACPSATPDGDGSAVAPAKTAADGETVPHAAVMSTSRQEITPETTPPRMSRPNSPFGYAGLHWVTSASRRRVPAGRCGNPATRV